MMLASSISFQTYQEQKCSQKRFFFQTRGSKRCIFVILDLAFDQSFPAPQKLSFVKICRKNLVQTSYIGAQKMRIKAQKVYF